MNPIITNKRILVTGGAGFIGSNLVEELLKQGNQVVVLDNFSTGKRENLAGFDVILIEGDIRNFEDCQKAVTGCDYVLHQAALGSVPRSFANPQQTLENNVQGFNNMIEAARMAGVKRFVYASSSSVYGDDNHLPKVEEHIGNPLSPYALSKQLNEKVATDYNRIFGMETVGLRYFNVFGKRQDPNGAYAAVIPKFVKSLLNHESPTINGDGSYSRDFTYVDNIVKANLLALAKEKANYICNIAGGEQITLNDLLHYLKEELSKIERKINIIEPIYGSYRIGDIPHSLANTDKAQTLLGFSRVFTVRQGIKLTVEWYAKCVKQMVK